MGADKSDENTQNAPKFICPKDWDFDEKRLHWVSVVRDPRNLLSLNSKQGPNCELRVYLVFKTSGLPCFMIQLTCILLWYGDFVAIQFFITKLPKSKSTCEIKSSGMIRRLI